MAERVPVLPVEMRDSISFSETGSDLGDTNLQGTQDDLLDRDSGYVEDRFRVDRKKLEQMLQGHLEHGDEGAEDFFQRIMDETNTQISWPSKLKIGAKSKKDPHIKVVGLPEDVRQAKDLIMSVLDTKTNRVTLKMDVSHTDHSHVIGKGGNNIKRVMQETGCHIHFPDSNRGNNVQEKSNQVSIAGQPDGVETARIQIRELLPLVFMFELPGVPQALTDVASPAMQQIQQQYNVTISFRQRNRMYVTTVIVRGSVCNEKLVKEATLKLMENLLGNLPTPVAVSMQLEIAPQHHLFIIGRGGMNIKQIMQSTAANIHFPEPSTVTPQRKGTVYITGTIDSVFLARQQLIGCLPLVLMFEVKDEIDMDQGRITHLMERLDVFISVKPKPKQPSKSVIVKSIERNARNMYLARQLLLGLQKEVPRLISVPGTDDENKTNTLGLSALGYFGQNIQTTLNVNTTTPLLLMNGNKSPSVNSPRSPHSSPSSSSPNHWVSPPPGIYAPMMVLPGSSQVQNALDLITQCNGLQKEFTHNNSYMRIPTPLDRAGNTNQSETTSPSRSPCDSPPISFRETANTVDLAGLSTNSFGKIMTNDTQLTSSGHTMDLLGLSKTTSPPLNNSRSFLNSSLGNGSLQGSLTRTSLQNSDPIDQGLDPEGMDLRAPGIERKNSSTNMFGPQYPFNEDYEQKKLLASKAMQKKPIGEYRIPTDIWSGLGFSKSMPGSVIREKLSQHGVSERYKTPMDTQYENAAEELSSEIDGDPWKDTSQSYNRPINPAPGEYPSPRKKYEYGLSNSNHMEPGLVPNQSCWSPKTDLAELFSTMGLGKYTDLFQQQEIDLSTFLTLTDQDLRELGITTFGARRRMLMSIADLNKRRTLMSVNGGPSTSNPFQDTDSTHVSRPGLASISGRW